MNLTTEQLEQCRKEFEAIFDNELSFYMLNGDYADMETVCHWSGFKAAWRPVPSEEEIVKIIDPLSWNKPPMTAYEAAQSIYRAFGGKDE